MEKKYNRLQVSLSDNLSERIEAYAEMMGVSIPEAARHLMMRGLEQVQILVNAKNSVDALNRMTEVFDKGMESDHKPARRASRKSVPVAVTPEQSLKSETPRKGHSGVKDIFK